MPKISLCDRRADPAARPRHLPVIPVRFDQATRPRASDWPDSPTAASIPGSGRGTIRTKARKPYEWNRLMLSLC
jgi:hypothetical protein